MADGTATANSNAAAISSRRTGAGSRDGAASRMMLIVARANELVAWPLG